MHSIISFRVLVSARRALTGPGAPFTSAAEQPVSARTAAPRATLAPPNGGTHTRARAPYDKTDKDNREQCKYNEYVFVLLCEFDIIRLEN